MPFHRHLSVLMTGLLTGLVPASNAVSAESLPTVKLSRVRRAFDNGEHNAFTDLCKFNGQYYLTFRSCPDGHGVHPTSSIIVLTSKDTSTWEQVHRFSVPKRDTRDPHFLVFKGRLFLFTGTWYCGDSSPKQRTMNEHLGYAVWTKDGRKWHDPVLMEGSYGHYVWRAATFGDKAYLCARRIRGHAKPATRKQRDPLVESAMLESEDGIVWRKVGLFQEQFGDETAFIFEEDGSVLALARSGAGRNAQVCRAKPPYREFQRKELDRYVGGPLLTKWNGHYLVGGRRIEKGKPVTSLYWLAHDRLHELATLPSGGDTSYPGFVPISETRGLVSWYSSHEKDKAGQTITAIYLAELQLED